MLGNSYSHYRTQISVDHSLICLCHGLLDIFYNLALEIGLHHCYFLCALNSYSDSHLDTIDQRMSGLQHDYIKIDTSLSGQWILGSWVRQFFQTLSFKI